MTSLRSARLLIAALLALPLLASVVGEAAAKDRVRKVDGVIWECRYDNAAPRRVTAGSREEARELCKSLKPAGATLLDVVDVSTATPQAPDTVTPDPGTEPR